METEKAILAIETSGTFCGASVYFNPEKYFSAKVKLRNSHSEKLLPLINNVMNSGGVTPSEIEAVAVSVGPGSFTGLRIGMAAAKGLAYGWKIPIIPVPTFDAIAFEISDLFDDNLKFYIANKVNNDEVYLAMFQIKANSYIFVEELHIEGKEKLNEIIGANAVILGNAFGDQNSKFSSPSPEFIARWAKQFGENLKTFDYDFLEPNYLKSFLIKEKLK